MRRALVCLFILFIVPCAVAQNRTPRRPTPPPPPPPPAPAPAPDPNFGQPLSGLTSALLARFSAGVGEFTSVEKVDDGLGPVFNGRSCAECHAAPNVGGSSRRVVTRIATRTNGVFDDLARFGGMLLQDHAIGPQDGSPHAFRPETVPPPATIVVHRRTTPLFGLGFIDATPDSAFDALATQEAARGDGTAGRVNRVQNLSAGMVTSGKFGWKAQVPSLFQFAGDAYLNEMGITNPQFPNENCPSGNCAELAFNPQPGLNDSGDGVTQIADFMTMLSAPPRGPVSADSNDGERVFSQLGCDACHTPALQTGPSPIAALNRKTYHPYSDFLLHDMGTLGDGLEQGDAKGREMRTAPLWGLRAEPTLLHDGRATTVDQAILAHDGQARASRDRFVQLDERTKQKLRAFLNSL